jgi:hypothetical protein
MKTVVAGDFFSPRRHEAHGEENKRTSLFVMIAGRE